MPSSSSSSEGGAVCFCSCSSEEESINNTGGSTAVRKHRQGCIYHGGRITKDQFRIMKMRERWEARRAERQGRRQQTSVETDDDATPGEYVPRDLEMSQNLRGQIHNLKSRKQFLAVGYGRAALNFKVKKITRRALRGGVKIEESTLNLVQGRSNIPLDTPITDLMTSLDMIFDKIIKQALKGSKSPQDKLQLVVRTEHVKIADSDSGMKHPIRSEMISVGEWLNNENEKSRVLAKLFSKIEPYDFITLSDKLIIETILVKSKIDDKNSDSENDHSIKAAGMVGHRVAGVSTKNKTYQKAFVSISNNDKQCLARAVVVALCYERLNSFKRGSEEFKQAQRECSKIRQSDSRHSYQSVQALTLSVAAGLDPTEPTTDSDIPKIAACVQKTIKVIASENINCIEKFGDDSDDGDRGCLYLFREKVFTCKDKTCSEYRKEFMYHFTPIVDMKLFRNVRFYCTFCDIGYKFPISHRCEDILQSGKKWCFSCYSRKCSLIAPLSNSSVKCKACGEICKNNDCLASHVKLKICDKTWCEKCYEKLKRKKRKDGVFESVERTRFEHECKITCRGCLRLKKPNKSHKCFMTRKPFNARCSKLLFLDYETDQSSGNHVPIYCYLKWVEFNFDVDLKTETVIAEGDQEFGVNYATLEEVGDFLFSKNFSGFTVVAHNMKGFDGCFLLQYLIQKNISISIIPNGMKLTSLYIPHLKMRIIDSLNFLQMPLAAIPRAMGIEAKVSSKGYFPHFFTTPENLNYSGELPSPIDYGFEDMKSNADFFKWYENTKKICRETKEVEFDFQRDIRAYCKQDVEILMAGCLKFRELILETTDKIPEQPDVLPDDEYFVTLKKKLVAEKQIDSDVDDPFEFENLRVDSFDPGACDPFAYLTAPGMCGAIFKAKFLKRRAIAQINPAGYENFRYSAKACEYLQFLNIKNNSNIIHALNSPTGHEICLEKKFRVDGFDKQTNTIFEFHGCFWHGCPKCIRNRAARQPVRQVSYEFLYNETIKRENELKELGYKVISIWECEWEQLKKNDKTVKEIVKNIQFKTRLNPRDSFRGGRVETSKIYFNRFEKSKNKEGLHYFDVCSLYPAVNCFDSYPVGHPKIITENFNLDISEYFGLIQCSVLAPKNLRHAVLPVHVDNKLLFPLCRSCAFKRQVEICKHSEAEREFHGVWVSEELKLAVQEGYEIRKIFGVHHYERQSKELFRDYIKTFYKIKLAASPRPPGESAEELSAFIERTAEKEGITLEPKDFKFNQGLRMVGKLCCNCLWGRMGMRDIFHSVTLCYDMHSLHKILFDQHNEISCVRYVSENCVAVLYCKRSVDILNFTNNTSIILAVFTTANARIRLFQLIKKMGARVVYTDTDSIFYEKSSVESENLPTGQFLGELTNELDENEVIDEFVSGGPKIYAYKTSKGKTVVKIKGFQLNVRNSEAFSFENLKRVILSQFEKNFDNDIGRMRFVKNSLKDARQKLYDDFHGLVPNASSVIATDDAISVFDASRIRRDFAWSLLSTSEQKMYSFQFDKRIILEDFSCVPFGFVENDN